MVSKTVGRFAFALIAVAVIVGIAAPASAQITTPISFERVGDPGFTFVTQTDPLDPTRSITVQVDTGAFVNPCTLENVDVVGNSTISTSQTIDKQGNLRVNVSVVTKGTGLGWKSLTNYAAAIFTGSTYTYNDSQQFTFKLPPPNSGSEEFVSDFTDRISMRGAKSVDNWTIRAHFKIRVAPDGTTRTELIKMTAGLDGCKG